MTRVALATALLAALLSCGKRESAAPPPALGPSQARARNETARERYERYLAEYQRRQQLVPAGIPYDDPESAFGQSSAVAAADFGSVPEVTSAQLELVFRWIRDTPFIPTPELVRRESWLYPDDGCYSRSELAARRAPLLGLPAPSKVFIFGDLEVSTPNSPDGKVYWWYHVAPAYRVGPGVDAVRIIDPGIEPTRPLSFGEWSGRQAADLSATYVAVCASRTYEPGNSCLDPSSQDGQTAEADEQQFLSLEWDRQLELGRDPSLVLGTAPPWLK